MEMIFLIIRRFLLSLKNLVGDSYLRELPVINIILALSAVHISIVEVNVQEMFLDLRMLLDVAVVAGKVDAMHA